jgi:hypothetical protein
MKLRAFGLACCSLMLSCSDEATEPPPRFDSRVDLSAACQLPTVTDAATEARSVATAEGRATATLTVDAECARAYELSTDAPSTLESIPNPRPLTEVEGGPFTRTNDVMFDALYALALTEVRENSVESIETFGFNNGDPVACPPGGCFETGEFWTYVWTRDISYSVDLGLAELDPLRARNSLEFKTSELRSGGGRQIVQDTGTGGSYPISSDRVVWSLGARRLLSFLAGEERRAFRDLALEVARDTIDHDRAVVFDEATGLYRGEQSFLDWREQSYPIWVRPDVAHVGMSKSLSTNVGHLSLLELAAELSSEVDDEANATRYAADAAALRTAVRERLWLEDEQMLSTYLVTELDPLPARRFDALGMALAILYDVVDAETARGMLDRYPVMTLGPPVIWPQQPGVEIYHNRAMWPFVTAYWLRAAKKARHARALAHGVEGLIALTATHLSNMENYEMVTGQVHFDDEPWSGPVVNSPRQLWSVAGFVNLVHEIVFGVHAAPEGLVIDPYLPQALASRFFERADRIVLNRLPYRGRELTIVVHAPDAPVPATSALVVEGLLLDGRDHEGPIGSRDLREHSVVEVFMLAEPAPSSTLRVFTEPTRRDVFPPQSPTIRSFAAGPDGLSLSLSMSDMEDVTMTIHRDGETVAEGLDGAETWTDPDPSHESTSHCYTVETIYRDGQLPSQRSQPRCWWGAEDARVRTLSADQLTASGGTLEERYGRWHFSGWGEPGDRIEASDFRPAVTGPHLVHVGYANAIGPPNTGITCAVKRLEVRDVAADEVVASGYVFMPHGLLWGVWRQSNPIRVELDASRTYALSLGDDAYAHNMSALRHFEVYTGGAGGTDGPYNRANVSDITVSALTAD